MSRSKPPCLLVCHSVRFVQLPEDCFNHYWNKCMHFRLEPFLQNLASYVRHLWLRPCALVLEICPSLVIQTKSRPHSLLRTSVKLNFTTKWTVFKQHWKLYIKMKHLPNQIYNWLDQFGLIFTVNPTKCDKAKQSHARTALGSSPSAAAGVVKGCVQQLSAFIRRYFWPALLT